MWETAAARQMLDATTEIHPVQGLHYTFLMKFGIVSNMGLLFNQQHAADAQVQFQEQDDCRYVTYSGAQPVGTELLPEDIIAPLSDLYPHGLWGEPEEINV
ncbi:unnamed protein product [Sphagnum troendelagicum]|uniref:Uncharacterized protein n=1 Tax=Sphagnum troendelagicum TaxID=128251 RepID=A0ABP0U7D4_9BRYO